ncbi:MAG: WxcM-like domain-containing protein [Pirellulales bacterium]|nr:WxcM-like domain-containing protein [Pirellulales bacterium]
MKYDLQECVKHTDQRGYLVEFLRRDELVDLHVPFGQIYFVTFERPGQVRGNHFHKRGSEWFGVAEGTLEVVLEDVRTKERAEFILRSDDKLFHRLTIGPYIAHAFRNMTPTAILIDYTSEQFDRQDPDRNPYILLEPLDAHAPAPEGK